MGFKLKTYNEILQNLHQVLISWDRSLYTVGSEIIDYQHQQLVLQINQLYDAYIKHVDTKLLGNILDQLEHYIAYHFQTEECFLNNYLTDEVRVHISEHRFFTEKVSTFSKQYFSGNTDIAYEVILFLKDWLMNHIQCRDFNSRHMFDNNLLQ
jgi:hemerythrin